MATRKEQIAIQIAKAVGAGRPVSMETVDFSDPDRPKTCIEVDFPLVAINDIASLEAASGALKKPIYKMSKWWARRQSSVFRSILIAAATKAPEDPSHAAKLVWDNYYGNHRKKGAFKKLKVADIFMGGGTTLVEGSRLGMQMSGNDLNPIAWFVVKQELADIDPEEVKRLLDAIESEVRPQIIPYFSCDGPNGEKGRWTHLPTGRIEGANFDPLSITPERRCDYRYEGPEIIFTFWAKHGPCQVTGCGHRTPILTSPIVAAKSVSAKYWPHKCVSCGKDFDIEESPARLAPNAPLVVAQTESPFAIIDSKGTVTCPACNLTTMVRLGKSKNKKIELSLFIQPEWLSGSAKLDVEGQPLGGSAQDDAASTARWNNIRAHSLALLEVRGELPEEVTCPTTKRTFATGKKGGTVPKKSAFSCAACGTVQDVMASIKMSGKSGPIAGYAIQVATGNTGYSANNERYFAAFDDAVSRQYNAAVEEWETRKEADLADYWPRSKIPYGFMTSIANSDLSENYGLTHWWTMFNPRQLLVNSLLLKAIWNVGGAEYKQATREFVLGAFQQFLRCNNLLSIWHMRNNQISAALSNSNFYPKNTSLEPSIFALVGDGNWKSAVGGLFDGLQWKKHPWELVSNNFAAQVAPSIANDLTGKSEKIPLGDVIGDDVEFLCRSSTDLTSFGSNSFDMVITDPPFGGLLHYSELSDFFYVWLRLA